MSEREAVRILPRSKDDRWEPLETDRFTRRVGAELKSRLGDDTLLAARLTSRRSGSVTIEQDPYWLQADYARVEPLTPSTWIVWVSIALLFSVLGAAVIASLINKPLKNLSFAASRIREGEYDSRLDESNITTEIRGQHRLQPHGPRSWPRSRSAR
jgi:two-component system osmolarity sensor histidine kinase EnvZ